MRIIADKNFPRDIVLALRQRGHDVIYVSEMMSGAMDDEILAFAHDEHRLMITYDKDFGELAFRHRQPSHGGIILFRIPYSDPEASVRIVIASIESRDSWDGLFAVISKTGIRITSMPA